MMTQYCWLHLDFFCGFYLCRTVVGLPVPADS